VADQGEGLMRMRVVLTFWSRMVVVDGAGRTVGAVVAAGGWAGRALEAPVGPALRWAGEGKGTIMPILPTLRGAEDHYGRHGCLVGRNERTGLNALQMDIKGCGDHGAGLWREALGAGRPAGWTVAHF